MADSPYSFAKADSGSWPLGRPEDDCCTGCPIREGCALAADTYVVCPITGSTPPPPPPAHVPAADAFTDEPAARRFDITDVASRGVEAALSGAFGFGWTDVATALIERSAVWDSDGNRVDWARLQIKRNLLCIAVATAAPIGDHTATVWIANALRTYSISAVFVPAGMALGVVMPVIVGQFVPGIGGLCRAAVGVTAFVGRATWRFLTSRMGWVVTRPAIWAVICGLATATWRFVVYRLTGAV
ncbi:hypothetical protein [Streptomyces chattanoogensis]|uniref:Uncharacterized protein n=1 Tax=Streptomyces chattanoogensis TaxID=66876 RepID=A0A0N0GXU2_9ACTN|nr:hypothetical protein [Streptomyces chattanoogensis]KPC61262.1 hypothetical protein ADL29_25235 [Streptomyces chattanoogensis]